MQDNLAPDRRDVTARLRSESNIIAKYGPSEDTCGLLHEAATEIEKLRSQVDDVVDLAARVDMLEKRVYGVDVKGTYVRVRYDASLDAECRLHYDDDGDGTPILVVTFSDRIPANVALQQMRAMAGAPYFELPEAVQS